MIANYTRIRKKQCAKFEVKNAILQVTKNTLFAGKIIYYLLGILGVRDISLFLTSYIAVIFAVVITYGLMYWVTSTIYYKIVQTK